MQRKFLIITLTIIVILILVPLLIAMTIYNENFGERFETPSYTMRNLNEFDGLKSQKYTFKSNKEQELVGYTYYKDKTNPKGLIVISHGFGGGGHNSYMDIADYFASNNYIVFAYDGTGNDESDGEKVIGLPQGVIDLDYALKFIKSNSDFSGLPIMLFGQSWGGYSVGSVLNLHTDIKAVVMLSGFNNSLDMIKEQGKQLVGNAIQILSPYIYLVESLKFGKYGSYNCIDGFDNVDTKVMIVHSADDSVISIENTYDVFYNLYNDNPRFKFIKYEDRGHSYLQYTDEAREYIDNVYEKFKVYKESLDEKITSEQMNEFFNNNIDKEIYYQLDKKLLDEIVEFYDTYTKN